MSPFVLFLFLTKPINILTYSVNLIKLSLIQGTIMSKNFYRSALS